MIGLEGRSECRGVRGGGCGGRVGGVGGWGGLNAETDIPLRFLTMCFLGGRFGCVSHLDPIQKVAVVRQSCVSVLWLCWHGVSKDRAHVTSIALWPVYSQMLFCAAGSNPKLFSFNLLN